MEIKTLVKYQLTPVRWPSLKCLQITNARKGVKKRKPFYNVGGSVNWYSRYGKQCGGSSEI